MLRRGRAGASAGGHIAHDMGAQAAVAAAARRAHAGAWPVACCLAGVLFFTRDCAAHAAAVFSAQEEASAALPGNAVLAKPLNELPATTTSGEELANWGGQWRKHTK